MKAAETDYLGARIDSMLVEFLALRGVLADRSRAEDGAPKCCVCDRRDDLRSAGPAGVFACRPCLTESVAEEGW